MTDPAAGDDTKWAPWLGPTACHKIARRWETGLYISSTLFHIKFETVQPLLLGGRNHLRGSRQIWCWPFCPNLSGASSHYHLSTPLIFTFHHPKKVCLLHHRDLFIWDFPRCGDFKCAQENVLTEPQWVAKGKPTCETDQDVSMFTVLLGTGAKAFSDKICWDPY